MKTTDKEFVLPQLPANILLDIARNESADHVWRKAATKFLVQNNCKEAKHPDLVWFVKELEKEAVAEKDVAAVVEAATEEELPESVVPAYPELALKIATDSSTHPTQVVEDGDPRYPRLADQVEQCEAEVNKIHEYHGIKREESAGKK